MKKFLIVIVVVFSAVNVNAQWFLGGDVGLGVENVNRKIDSVLEHSSTNGNFSLSPKVGYYFNEKFALGLNFRIGTTFRMDTLKNATYKDKEYNVNWSICPFVRYSVFTYKRISLILEGKIGVGMSHTFHKIESDKIIKGFTILSIGVFNVTPILSFNLTEHFQMEAGLNFLNFGYNVDITKANIEEETGALKVNIIKHDFNTGFNSGNIFSLSQLTIGVIYKF